jgi:hypothetical protein
MLNFNNLYVTNLSYILSQLATHLAIMLFSETREPRG